MEKTAGKYVFNEDEARELISVLCSATYVKPNGLALRWYRALFVAVHGEDEARKCGQLKEPKR